MTNDKLADEIERQLRNDGLRIQVDELSDASPHAAVHRRVQFAAPSWKQILAALRTERPQRKPTNAPFANCTFQECDLPGQCIGEGKCHHPAERPPSGEMVLWAWGPNGMVRAGEGSCGYVWYAAEAETKEKP